MSAEFQYDVFLSHNSADKPRVRRLAERLKAAGLQVWFDEWTIQPGDDIYLAVERGLEASRTLVLCLSPAALGSDWVTLERNTVLFRDPTNKGRRFVPLLLADCKLPDTLRRYKYVDYRQEAQPAFEQLLAGCQPPEQAGAISAVTQPPSDSAANPTQDTELPDATGTNELIEFIEYAIRSGSDPDPVMLSELQSRWSGSSCPAEEKEAIVRLDRNVLIPHYGHTKLPPAAIPLPGTRAPTPRSEIQEYRRFCSETVDSVFRDFEPVHAFFFDVCVDYMSLVQVLRAGGSVSEPTRQKYHKYVEEIGEKLREIHFLEGRLKVAGAHQAVRALQRYRLQATEVNDMLQLHQPRLRQDGVKAVAEELSLRKDRFYEELAKVLKPS